MKTLPLSDFGLVTVTEVAAAYGYTPSAVHRWVRDGRLPAVVVGGEGLGSLFLLRRSDVAEFTPPPRGRKVGSKDGKPRKTRRWDKHAEVYRELHERVVEFLKAHDDKPAPAAEIAEALG